VFRGLTRSETMITESQTNEAQNTQARPASGRKRWRSVRSLFLRLFLICLVVMACWLAARYAHDRAIEAVRQGIAGIAHGAGMTVQFDEVRLDGLNRISMSGITLRLGEGGASTEPFAVIPELDVAMNLVLAFLGRPVPVALTAVNPRVDAKHRADGTWAVPRFDKFDEKSGAFRLNNVYSLVVHVESGQLDVRDEKENVSVTAHDIDLSVRSSADKQSFHIESTCLVPRFSANPLTVEGQIYPAERRFNFATKAAGMNAAAIADLFGGSFQKPRGGTMTATCEVRGVMGKETLIQSSIAFSGLDVAPEPAFLRSVTGTADLLVTVNHETGEVSINSPNVDTPFCHGSFSGTVVSSENEPRVNIRARFDRFAADELVRKTIETKFPDVSDLDVVVNRQAELDADIQGVLNDPDISLAVSIPDSRVAFVAKTHRYGRVSADLTFGATSARWNIEQGVSGEAAVSDGSVSSEQIPFSVRGLSGTLAFSNGLVRTDSLSARLDEVPVTVTGYADISPAGVRAAEVGFRCTIDELSGNRYAHKLEQVNLSGRAELAGSLFKLGDSVIWNVDGNLTGADVRVADILHKPAGSAARFHADGPFWSGKPFRIGLGLSLEKATMRGSATLDQARSPAITALDLRSDEFQLGDVMSLLNLPVEVRENTGAKLALSWRSDGDKPSITADLSADRLIVAFKEEQNLEPLLLGFDNVQIALEKDGDRYLADIRSGAATLSPSINDLVRGGYRLRFITRLTSPLRIDADVGEFICEPYHVEQLRCAILVSTPQLKLASATGRTAGGNFELQSTVMRNDKMFSLEYKCDGFDIGQMLSRVSEASGKLSGRLSATLSLSGALGTPDSTSGQGILTVTEGKIDSSYFISRMRGLEEDPAPNPIQFDRLRCDFLLDKDTVTVSNLRFEKPGLVLRGQGSVTLDGRVDQTFDVDMSRKVAQQLSVRKRWGLIDLLPVPGVTTGPVTRTFRVRGTFGKLKTEVEKRPLHVELVRGTMAFSEGIVVAGVTVLALPARMFMDILTLVPLPENHENRG